MTNDNLKSRWLIEIAIEPKSRPAQAGLAAALAQLAADDPTFGFSTDPESGQTILKGTSESHIAAKVDLIRNTYKVDANVGAPQVSFLERPTKKAEVKYTHKKQTGGTGQFAEVSIIVEPNEPGKGYGFESKIIGGAVPKQYIPGVEKGIESVLVCGVVAGFPVVDVKVMLIDGKYHDVDSSVLAFEIAARAAFREALQKAESVLLEPIVKVEVVAPAELTKSVIDDLNLRRAEIQQQGIRANARVITATVQLMNMFGYEESLRRMSEGRASFSMQFERYAPSPLSPHDDDPPFRPAIGMRA
jgi:elongation factor G